MWILIPIIIGLVIVGLYGLSARFRGVVHAVVGLIWAVVSRIAQVIGVRVVFVVIGLLLLAIAANLLVFWVGYGLNWNWLIQPVMALNFILLFLFMVVIRRQFFALLFMFFCTVTLFAHADVTVFKTYQLWILGYTLFCMFFVAFGVYVKKITNIPAYFLSTVLILTLAYDIFTHVEKDRWESWRDRYLATREIQVTNTNSKTASLKNDWKWAVVKAQYKIIVTDNGGRIVPQPEFEIVEGARVLIYAKPNPTIPKTVDEVFRGLPVYEIADPTFQTKKNYWILQSNIKIATDPDEEGVVVQKEKPPDTTRTISAVVGDEWKAVAKFEPGEAIFVHNAGQDTVFAKWGQWRCFFPPNEWKSYSFGGYKPGNEYLVKNKDGVKEVSVLTIKVYKTGATM